MNKCILAVEDDLGILEILQLILLNEGYKVVTYTSGKHVEQLIEEHHPDLVLMDIRLGDMDGREICKSIKADEKYQDTPVVLMSAHKVSENVMAEAFANDFIPKPFDIDELLRRIKRLISKDMEDDY